MVELKLCIHYETVKKSNKIYLFIVVFANKSFDEINAISHCLTVHLLTKAKLKSLTFGCFLVTKCCQCECSPRPLSAVLCNLSDILLFEHL